MAPDATVCLWCLISYFNCICLHCVTDEFHLEKLYNASGHLGIEGGVYWFSSSSVVLYWFSSTSVVLYWFSSSSVVLVGN
jgi:hypothetical protein